MTDTPASADLSDASEPSDPRRTRLLALIVASALFMQSLDSTIITTAMPKMAMSFGVEPADLSIGITSYMLALAAVLPVSGWIADRFGPRNVFAGSIILFTIASLLCAVAPNLWAFTAARVLQGIGGSMLTPVGRLVALKDTSKKDLLSVVALMVWPSLAAPIIGPALGGFIVTYASWPWIFLVNLPIGVVGVAMVMRFIPNKRETRRSPFDTLGFIVSAASLVCLIGGLELVAHSATPWAPLALLAMGGVLAVTAVRRFAASPHPLIPLDALKIQTFAAVTLWSGTAFRMAIFAAPFLLPLMFQVGFGFSPIHSGMLLLVLFAGNLAMKPFTAPVLRMFGFRTVLIVNGVLAAVLVASYGLFSADTPFAVMGAALFLGGAFRSMQFTCLDSLSYADVPPAQRTGATTLAGVTGQVGQVLGVAIAAVLLSVFQHLRGGDAAAAIDFRLAFPVVALLPLIALPGYLALPKNAGAEVTGHRA